MISKAIFCISAIIAGVSCDLAYQSLIQQQKETIEKLNKVPRLIVVPETKKIEQQMKTEDQLRRMARS